MTNQASEILIIESAAIDLPAMALYGVVAGNLDEPASWGPYLFETKGNKAKMTMCSALWRGYISTYRLRSDGTFCLEKLNYPFTEGAAPDEVQELLRGGFWLDFRESFTGDGVKVPFANGYLVCDQTRWKRREGHDKKRFQQEWDALHCGSLVVSADQTVPHSMQGYKLYVNGNIRGTPSHFADPAPANGLHARLEPGAYRVVVREAAPTKIDRAESNTLNVQVQKNRILNLKLTFVANALKLVQEEC
ncbi:hypothetical protein [Massilia sp. CCM 8734]|uniref:hypothetical protein n=1 Tax=Massilia sp. CCM 8734 TaxID=2609283 RepID=UPI00141E22D2|nr:hypothetical protein [Massilia sp. CCM 8734]NHZ96398.1 hypothetical protein [Massilia sp. CCM 8734]